MEAAQLSPHGGERPDDPGTRDSEPNARNAATCHADGGPQGSGDNEGSYDAGATRHEDTRARDSRTWSDETPGDGHVAGARSPRACDDDGAGTSSFEGPKDSGTWSAQGYGDSGTCSHETSGDPRAQISETTGDPRAWDIEGPRARISETRRDPRARISTASGDPGARDNEGPRAQSNGAAGSSFPEGTRPTSNEGPRDSGIISQHSEEPENPRDGANAVPHDARVRSPDQRLTGFHAHEGTHAARTCHEGPNAVIPAQSNDAGAEDPTEQSNAESIKGGHGSGSSQLGSSSEGAESFKKPIAPSRSSGNEKTLEQCIKPSGTPSAQPPPLAGRKTASDDSSRLPSDAYRASPAIPYREPAWSGLPEALYTLEVLKGGSILSTKNLNGASWTVFGRLPTCHVSLEHPSVSRYHAVLQYRSVPGTESDEDPGFYVYDLGSTHGTFINKQRIQTKTYCRFRVGHVLKFGGSTRLFVLQGPDEDQEAESELTVTQIKEARRQKESLQKRMLGDDSDEEDLEEDGEEKKRKEQGGSEDSGCMWGMGEDAEEEEENDVNPIAIEYQAEREALYSGNPKKALQGWFDREGEELDFEYEEQGIGSWLCRVKLPVDDSSGKQLVAEVIHSGKKRDAMRLCCMEACRMLDMRGLLRQEAVSRKRKSKQWEAEDFYDSDDDTFLDRTGIVEKKRLNRMKKAGKIEEKPETYESLTTKLDLVEKEIAEIAAKLRTNHQDEAQTSAQDSLDAFMTEIKSGATLDNVTRKKLHLQSLELKKEQQRLKSLIKLVQPTKLPELKATPAAEDSKTKKLMLPMFGAMKGGSKFKLKTGTVGRLPPKRTDLPSSLFTMKGDDNEPEEEEEEDEDDDMQVDKASDSRITAQSESLEQSRSSDPGDSTCPTQVADVEEKVPAEEPKPISAAPSVSRSAPNSHKPPAAQIKEKVETAASKTQKKMLGPSRPPPGTLSSSYPEDDPDYCVWTPPTGQTGDGKTHLNEKYGY